MERGPGRKKLNSGHQANFGQISDQGEDPSPQPWQ